MFHFRNDKFETFLIMEPILNSKPFDLFVTHVKKEHGLVKIFGQVDVSTGQVVEKYLKAVQEQLEGGNAPQLASLEVGQVIVARYCTYSLCFLSIFFNTVETSPGTEPRSSLWIAPPLVWLCTCLILAKQCPSLLATSVQAYTASFPRCSPLQCPFYWGRWFLLVGTGANQL